MVRQKIYPKSERETLDGGEMERIFKKMRARSGCDCEYKEICGIFTEDLRGDAKRMRIYGEVKHLIEPCPLKGPPRWTDLCTWHGWTEWYLEEYVRDMAE